MKTLYGFLALLVLAFIRPGFHRHDAAPATTNELQPVNALLGDVSFVQRFGRLPDAATPENLRIKTHLAFVAQKLRDNSPPGLSDARKENRAKMLALLDEYNHAGRFPSNYDYPGVRKPCFIDRDGAICAVGYLIAQSAGRELAEKINRIHQYDYLADMNLPELDQWIAGSGLTRDECAFIQPQYYTELPDEYITRNHLPTPYAVTSGALAGLNGTLGVLNIRHLQAGTGNSTLKILGIAGGAASIALGLHGLLTTEKEYIGTKINGRLDYEGIGGYATKADVYARNPLHTAVSWANIGIGAASVLLGSWNLLPLKRPGKSSRCPDIAMSPVTGPGMGVRLVGTF